MPPVKYECDSRDVAVPENESSFSNPIFDLI